MLLRALVVLLVILNFGVAVWWALRGDPGDAAALADAGPSTLQLVGEQSVPARVPEAAAPGTALSEDALTDPEAPAAADVPLAQDVSPAAPAQCVALGPFADVASRDAALAQLATSAARVATREVGETPRGWRVWMAPLQDRATADATVARLLDAGFNDYYVIADGAEANGIALGRFGSEAPARSRAEALRAAGFDAEAAPLGSTLTRYWIDAMAADGVTGDTLRTRTGAARVETRDCNVQWVAG